MALAVAVRGARVLVARRAAGAHLGGAWEFPGGRIEPGEGAAEAARRELEEETGLRAVSLEPLVTVLHDYPDRPLCIHAYLAVEPQGQVAIEDQREWAWVRPEELDRLPMPEANRAILRAIGWRLAG